MPLNGLKGESIKYDGFQDYSTSIKYTRCLPEVLDNPLYQLKHHLAHACYTRNIALKEWSQDEIQHLVLPCALLSLVHFFTCCIFHAHTYTCIHSDNFILTYT